MTVTQWRHTEPSGSPEVYPLAPWVVHPDGDLPRDLVAELLSLLRDDVIGWTEIARRDVASSEFAADRAEVARRVLRDFERVVDRANRRASRRVQR